MLFGDIKVGEIFRHMSQVLIRVHDTPGIDKSCVVIEPLERRGDFVVFNNRDCRVTKEITPLSQIKVHSKFKYLDVEYIKIPEMGAFNCVSGLGASKLCETTCVERI